MANKIEEHILTERFSQEAEGSEAVIKMLGELAQRIKGKKLRRVQFTYSGDPTYKVSVEIISEGR